MIFHTVRYSLIFPITFIYLRQIRDVAQPGSVSAWGAGGRWFESSHPDKRKVHSKEWIFLLCQLEENLFSND